jgi:CRP-like cAMP-binding protein
LHYFLHENEVCTTSAFVIKGCLRAYTIDANGFEHILQFAPAGWWVADMHSLISKQPGQLIIDALVDTEVLLLDRKDQEKLFSSIPKFERFFRIITENALVSSHQRLLDNMSLRAGERYSRFCKRYPSLIDYLPQKQVAAYIGVTPEFLSKMKAELLKKK